MKLVSYDYKGSVQIGLLLGDDQVLNVAQILSAAGLGSDAGMMGCWISSMLLKQIMQDRKRWHYLMLHYCRQSPAHEKMFSALGETIWSMFLRHLKPVDGK